MKCSEHVISFDKDEIELYDAGLMGSAPWSYQARAGLLAKAAIILELWFVDRNSHCPVWAQKRDQRMYPTGGAEDGEKTVHPPIPSFIL